MTPTSELSLPARLAWTLLILITLYLCYFHNLGAIGFVGPDEPRYAWIARGMYESGDWVTPRLYGQPWFEKPVLYYWGAAASFKLFGVNEYAARFPGALAALLATLSLAWLASRLYGRETARWLLLLLPTTVGMIGFSHAAATDMPFSASITIAMVFATVIVGLFRDDDVHSPPRTPWLALLLFGFFLGLAVLAKGPAAIVLSGSSVLLWAAFTRRWRDALRCLHPVAIVSFCLTALPWYILCARRNPDFFRVFIIEHNFKRYLTPEFQHFQPFWFYIPIVLLALFPWSIFLIPAAKSVLQDLRANSSTRAASLFLLCWALFPILFFSISKSKLPGYILPAIPALVLLLSTPIANLVKDAKLSPRWPFLITASAFMLLGMLLLRYSAKIPTALCVSPDCGILRIWIFAVVAGAVAALFAALRQVRCSLFALVIATLLLVVEINRFLPNMDPGVSARDGARVAQTVWPGFDAPTAATWQLNRAFVYQLNYYLRAELPEWQPNSDVQQVVFTPKKHVAEIVEKGVHCVRFAIYPAVVPCRDSGSVRGLAPLDGSGDGGNRSGSRQPR